MKQGVALSVLSSCLFATLYYYATVLHPVSAGGIFAWRVVLALPVLALLISRARDWKTIGEIHRRLRREWRLWVALIVCSLLIGVQLQLFMWAPLYGYGLDVSLGYFLLPLVMVLAGRVVYGERLSGFQKAAVAMAAIGVAHEFLRIGSFSWATAVVALGYPPYFMLRRRLRMNALAGLWFDMLFLTPIALWVFAGETPPVIEQFESRPALWLLVPLLGAISSTALVCYLGASRRLPLGLFGILGYVEPVLLFWVALLLLGEPMSADAWWTYLPIWGAVLIMAAEGFLAWRREASREAREKRTPTRRSHRGRNAGAGQQEGAPR